MFVMRDELSDRGEHQTRGDEKNRGADRDARYEVEVADDRERLEVVDDGAGRDAQQHQ